MPVYVCPAAVVAAPCARVWETLSNLTSDGAWLGVDVLRAEPPGPLQPGQTVVLGAAWMARILSVRMEIGAMDEEKGVIDMRVTLPFGIINHEHMTLAPMLDGACRVEFG